jgi:glutamyl/glutaminyl-tRNA synthetase
MTIRTRFAPSPTGYLHIGGVRTALFNWLLTRRHGGQFILRIDDTDAERNRPEALQPILDGFRWLGIDWNEGPTPDGKGNVGPHAPYFQSQRNDCYVAAAMRLLASGHAYPDYATKEEVEATDRAGADRAREETRRDPEEIDKEKKAAWRARQFVFRGNRATTTRPTTSGGIARSRSRCDSRFRRDGRSS